MIKERAEELAAALKSGKYQQGKGYLKTVYNQYCCLGVACELSNQPFTKLRPDEQFYTISFDKHGVAAGHLPPDAQRHFGFHHCLGKRKDEKRMEISGRYFETLASANDSGVTFKEIADYILANYESL